VGRRGAAFLQVRCKEHQCANWGARTAKAVTTGLYTPTSPRAFVCVTHANAQGPVGVNNHTPPAWERDGNTLRWLTRRFTRFTEVAHDTRRGEEL